MRTQITLRANRLALLVIRGRLSYCEALVAFALYADGLYDRNGKSDQHAGLTWWKGWLDHTIEDVQTEISAKEYIANV